MTFNSTFANIVHFWIHINALPTKMVNLLWNRTFWAKNQTKIDNKTKRFLRQITKHFSIAFDLNWIRFWRKIANEAISLFFRRFSLFNYVQNVTTKAKKFDAKNNQMTNDVETIFAVNFSVTQMQEWTHSRTRRHNETRDKSRQPMKSNEAKTNQIISNLIDVQNHSILLDRKRVEKKC